MHNSELHIRLPEELAKKVWELKKQHGIPATELIRNALSDRKALSSLEDYKLIDKLVQLRGDLGKAAETLKLAAGRSRFDITARLKAKQALDDYEALKNELTSLIITLTRFVAQK